MRAATIVFCVCSSVVLSAAGAWAKTPGHRIVEASVEVSGVKHTAKVKIDARGRIRPWSKTKWASITPANGTSIFYWLGENRTTSGLEFERTGKGRNGYGLVTVGTTADAVTLGISLKDQKGFFKYQDLGSGNGNSQYVLTVTESQRQP